MTHITYDPDADAVYIRIGNGKIDSQADAGSLTYDLDKEGRIIGIEILSASSTLAPGSWQTANRPGSSRVEAAE